MRGKSDGEEKRRAQDRYPLREEQATNVQALVGGRKKRNRKRRETRQRGGHIGTVGKRGRQK